MVLNIIHEKHAWKLRKRDGRQNRIPLQHFTNSFEKDTKKINDRKNSIHYSFHTLIM